MLHGGKCTKGQVQAWALNRYYYQAMIPIKDASLIARCLDSDIRREWRSRLVDHDGTAPGEGGIARWLKLTDGLGLDRGYVTSLEGCCRPRASRSKPMCTSSREDLARRRSRRRSPSCSRRSSSASAWKACSRTTTSSPPRRSPISRSGRRRPSATPTSPSTTSSGTRAAPEAAGQRAAALEFKCDVLWADARRAASRLCGTETRAARRLRARPARSTS